jgi:alcohol dehydrogenase
MMNNFVFSVPTQIQFGPGVTRQTGAITKSLVAGGTSGLSVLVVVDPGVKGTAWLKDILDSFGEAGLQPHLFDVVKPNPKDADVYAAADQLRLERAGAVVGIGGGSTIDTAKTAALIATHGGTVRQYAGWGKVPGPVTPVVAIPTTAGSGSEVTSWAVITDTATHEKLALGDRSLAPTIALVDPLLTLSLPAGLTAATGMDALTHSIEAFICALSNPVNDVLALESIRLVAGNLPGAVADGQDLEKRQAMMLASTLGGIAINNADVAGVHCLSEGMGSLYDAPHGLLNAILLPYFMSYWQDSCRDRFVRIAEAFGVAPRPEEAVASVVALNTSLHLPRLGEIGVKKADLPGLAVLAQSNVSNSSNPMPMTEADYLGILEYALTGLPART